MRIHFYKLHLGGNSFILIDTASEKDLKLSEYPEISKSICNRRYGVGASGCIFLDEQNNLRLFRPDGTEASDFYDALFCAARYAFDSGRMNKNSHGEYEIRFNTLKGEKILKVISSREFELSLGSPFSLSSGKIINSESSSIMETIELEGKKIILTGGGSLLHNIDKLISKETGMPVYIAENSLDCVAAGAGEVLDNIDLLREVVSDSERRLG